MSQCVPKLLYDRSITGHRSTHFRLKFSPATLFHFHPRGNIAQLCQNYYKSTAEYVRVTEDAPSSDHRKALVNDSNPAMTYYILVHTACFNGGTVSLSICRSIHG